MVPKCVSGMQPFCGGSLVEIVSSVSLYLLFDGPLNQR